MKFLNTLFSFFSRDRVSRIYGTHHNAKRTQKATLRFLIEQGSKTAWGKSHLYTKKMTYEDFVQKIPISSYEDLFPYIERALLGEKDVLWPGRTMYFAKSSGTTNDRSKYIPMTKDVIKACHFRGGKDMMLFYLHHYSESRVVLGKTIGVGGSFDTAHPYAKDIVVGDLSAVIMHELPLWIRHRRAPRLETALLSTWEKKLDALARESLSEDVRAIAGVPSWSLLLIKKVLELSGKKSIYDVWPHFEVFFHGGVSLDPYRASFRELLGEDFHYYEVYNASEGFFAIQDDLQKKGEMLLMLDYHIFYEFVPLTELGSEHLRACTIGEVALNVPYALVISTSGGLWRYLIGDVIEFTSLSPYRIKIVGRTAHSINIFGEELMVGNTDKALADVCASFGASVEEYSVAPLLSLDKSTGAHEWVVEFSDLPDSIERFAEALDQRIREINSDYDAKRTGDMLLKNLILHSVPKGTFYAFMKFRNRLGGQAKVPRLSEKRVYIEQLLDNTKNNDT